MVVLEIKSADQYKQIKKDNPKVAVDFFATWCGPCRNIAPYIEELSEQFKGVKFVKVDVDKVSAVAEAERVNAMPTFKFIKNGETDKYLEVVGANRPKINESLQKLSNS